MTNIAEPKWKMVEPVERAPYITGCRDTHVLAEDERGQRYFVPSEWLASAPQEPDDALIENLEIAERGLMVATVASCNCGHPASISPEPEGHTLECRYRVLIVAAHALADARAAIASRLQAKAPETGEE